MLSARLRARTVVRASIATLTRLALARLISLTQILWVANLWHSPRTMASEVEEMIKA